jgi:hypothetical protein
MRRRRHRLLVAAAELALAMATVIATIAVMDVLLS